MRGDETDRALAVARRLAVQAGRLLHRRREGIRRITSKGGVGNIVTEMDHASEKLILGGIRRAFPGHALVAEESGRSGDAECRWFVDPLDGTVNFVHGVPVFAVSLGLIRVGGERQPPIPEVAVVHVPRLAETFTATRGGGARVGDAPIRVSDTAALSEAILATGFPYRRNELRDNNLENWNRFFLEVRGLRRMGSAAIDLAYVAAGRFDGFWELHLAPHDVAAGALLVREAGGTVTDSNGGEAWLRGGSIVASGPRLFDSIRSRIRR
jgi:myo-inositol-1(or 4)-monophosphatase